MKKAVVGKSVPDLEVQTTGGGSLRLRDLKGKVVVLYFYPKDDTPGCTLEGQDFRDRHDQFRKLKAVVYGVSRDSLASHEKFKAKFRFPFELIADEDEKLCRLFDVIREKSLYGKKYMGVDRSTFIMDEDGVLRREFRGVKVKGHVDEVIGEIRKLQSPASKRK
jgi:peroxiredoxin Q/BCP